MYAHQNLSNSRRFQRPSFMTYGTPNPREFSNPIILVIVHAGVVTGEGFVDIFVCDEADGFRFNIQHVRRYQMPIDPNQIGKSYLEAYGGTEPPELSYGYPDWFSEHEMALASSVAHSSCSNDNG